MCTPLPRCKTAHAFALPPVVLSEGPICTCVNGPGQCPYPLPMSKNRHLQNRHLAPPEMPVSGELLANLKGHWSMRISMKTRQRGHWSIRNLPEFHMDQWLPNLSESSGLHRHRCKECSSLSRGIPTHSKAFAKEFLHISWSVSLAERILHEFFRFRGKKLLTEKRTEKRTEKHTEERNVFTAFFHRNFPPCSICTSLPSNTFRGRYQSPN